MESQELMVVADPITSVSLRTSTLRLMQHMKSGAQTWDDFFRDWIEWTMERVELEEAIRALAEIHAGHAHLTPLSKVRKEVRAWTGV